jgi:hypothetical protein
MTPPRPRAARGRRGGRRAQDAIRAGLSRGNYVEGLVAPKVKGKLHIGRITGLSFGGATIDSAEIRGPDDSLFVALRRHHGALGPARSRRQANAAQPSRDRPSRRASQEGLDGDVELQAVFPARPGQEARAGRGARLGGLRGGGFPPPSRRNAHPVDAVAPGRLAPRCKARQRDRPEPNANGQGDPSGRQRVRAHVALEQHPGRVGLPRGSPTRTAWGACSRSRDLDADEVDPPFKFPERPRRRAADGRLVMGGGGALRPAGSTRQGRREGLVGGATCRRATTLASSATPCRSRTSAGSIRRCRRRAAARWCSRSATRRTSRSSTTRSRTWMCGRRGRASRGT